MEEKIQKLLDNKYENVVQFSVTNTTPNPIFLDLFNTSDLSVIPNSVNYIYPPNTVTGDFGIIAPIDWTAIATNGYLYAYDGSVTILIFDTNNNNVLIGSINLFGIIFSAGWLTYNPVNNKLYINDNLSNNIVVINCTTNTYLSTISIPSYVGMSVINTINNKLYISNSNPLIGTYIIDCTTDTLQTNIPSNSGGYLAYNSTNNILYSADTLTNTIDVIDCVTNTIVTTISVLNPFSILYVALNNSLYVDSNNSQIIVIDCVTNTILNTITIPILGGLGYPAYNSLQNQIYWGSGSGQAIVISCVQNLVIDSLFVGSSPLVVCLYNPLQNSVYFSTPLLFTITQVTTTGITATPYYISGSANYNSFVNNLNSEPIEIQMVRILTQNLTQLNNQFQITKIDSNGNQIFFAEFPINKIDIEQNNNIAELSLKDMVFDGRTYINQYQLNANQSMSFEIYYMQLDLTSATPTFPIFFKPKIQLKEYIKKELNL